MGRKKKVRELPTEKLSKNRFDGVKKKIQKFAAEDRQKTYSVEWKKVTELATEDF